MRPSASPAYGRSRFLARRPKVVMMLLIVLQTLLFLYKVLAHSDAPLDFLRNLVKPL